MGSNPRSLGGRFNCENLTHMVVYMTPLRKSNPSSWQLSLFPLRYRILAFAGGQVFPICKRVQKMSTACPQLFVVHSSVYRLGCSCGRILPTFQYPNASRYGIQLIKLVVYWS
jgi:hypothetical protein